MLRFFVSMKISQHLCSMKTNSLSNTLSGVVTLFVLILTCGNSFSQRSENIQIPWVSPTQLFEGERTITVPTIENQFLDGGKPNFYWKKELSGNPSIVPELEIVATQRAEQSEIDFLVLEGIRVGDADYQLTISNANTQKSVVLNLFPFISVGKEIHRITEININYRKKVSQPTVYKKSFAANSVLQTGSGLWYKISVKEDGIHKIDREFLAQCFEPMGVDISTIDPQNINIYGNGDGRLPELNSVPRTDDLAKNAIYIEGESDGVFDASDYILFYGWGPDRIYANGTVEMYQDKNPYSDVSCYFININQTETPLRIQDLASSTATVTHNVNAYSYFDRHENDIINLVKGGQRWYGELFDTELQRTFTFTVPNIVSSASANFKTFVAANANGGTNTHVYSVGGNTLGTFSLPYASSDYSRNSAVFSLPSPTSSISLTMTINRSAPDVIAYLDYIELNARRSLVMTGTQFNFRDLVSVGAGNVAEYTFSNLPTSGFIWDITDRHAPFNQLGSNSGTDFIFRAPADTIREYVASDGINFLTPNRVGEVQYQNLHALPQADYLIVTNRNFINEANRLAQLHESEGLTVHVVPTDEVYNEFSSGMVDATAIRMFAKMFYDRGASAPETRPKYLLLFGDGTFDHKNKVSNANFVQTYQVASSENHISALVTDDYFGLLDDNESISANDQMDIAVGRLLVSSPQVGKEQVDKIEHYMKNGSDIYSTATTNCASDNGSSTFGDWRLRYVQIADDEESGYFINIDCEPAATIIKDSFPDINIDKIYLDAYQQVATAGGERYPDVYEAINDRIERGALVVNYVGHGGEVGVAEERVITVPQIQGWKNIDKMTLLVSATCEFTKYDDPDRISAGEWASLNPYGGAIALMTTTRSVYFGVNSITINRFSRNVFDRDANFKPLTFGEIMRQTKNESGGSDNKRSFTLIGDPALHIALPEMNIVTDSVNGFDPAISMDTLKALSKVTIKGHLEDFNGNVLSGFNGVVYPSVLDKPKAQQTLGNDTQSPVINFELQSNKVYRGKASVNNGYFEYTFIVPKDINYSYGQGKLSYYAENGSYDALGSDTRVIVGGIDPNGLNDNQGPEIDLYLNEETFVSGGITDETPILIAKLYDENGINAVGNGIGHDLVAVVDGETNNPIILNDYYSSDLDSYQSGEIRYNFAELEPGEHTLSVKVWDVNNNSSEASLEFVVTEKEELTLDHVLNYPNPFTTYTEFFFEHNQACVDLQAQIQIFTVSGKLVKTINEDVKCDGFRSKGIAWNGRDDFGDQLAKGVYVYRVSVKAPDGTIAEKTEKLVILK